MKPKKIALLGNANNNFFSVARYLRDVGFEPHVYQFDYEVFPQFNPSADSYDNEWESFCHKLNWGTRESFLKTTKSELRNFFSSYDIIIACGNGPAFTYKAGVELDLFLPHGRDLNHLPYMDKLSPSGIFWYFLFNRYQKAGIRRAKHIISDLWPKDIEKRISRLEIEDKRTYSTFPFIYYPQYEGTYFKNYETGSSSIKEARNRSELLIFHHSRQYWKTEEDSIAVKGNDILYRGISRFKKEFPHRQIGLILFEYGPDVKASKQLLEQLKIADSVTWLPLSDRKDIMKWISYSDIVAGEFHNSFLTYGTIIEGMALSKPIMHRRDDELYHDNYSELYPMIHASNEHEVYNSLVEYFEKPEKFSDIGKGGFEWFKKHIIDRPLSNILQILERV